ncbi:hypothetical protein [Legionella sp.]|uniref:hypothetical protein n=1 Tax=Legionella sp. TaxID=459 RepID=UPI000CB5CCAE|nr:hypothetical protein [Legionella sp.]PJE17807.1 MAG: hypothetical protein CK430_01710 [Legionella sp.]
MPINPYAHFSNLHREQKENSAQESTEQISRTLGAEVARGIRTLLTQIEKMDAIRPNETHNLAKQIVKKCYNTIHGNTSGNEKEVKVEAEQEEITSSSPRSSM